MKRSRYSSCCLYINIFTRKEFEKCVRVEFSHLVHKNENFFGSEFEIFPFCYIVRHKYKGFERKQIFGLGHYLGRYDFYL